MRVLGKGTTSVVPITEKYAGLQLLTFDFLEPILFSESRFGYSLRADEKIATGLARLQLPKLDDALSVFSCRMSTRTSIPS